MSERKKLKSDSDKEPLLIGYFPKKPKKDIEMGKFPGAKEICSASLCFFEEPENWIDIWKHNECFLYGTPEIAFSIIQDYADKDDYDLYAFKQFPIKVENSNIIEEPIRCEANEPLPPDFIFLGFDAVSKHLSDQFGCSPLSCNYGAQAFKANEYCLFSSYDEALLAAKEFSTGKWEPGPYYVVEVYRQRKA